jgi:hypothetical protein
MVEVARPEIYVHRVNGWFQEPTFFQVEVHGKVNVDVLEFQLYGRLLREEPRVGGLLGVYLPLFKRGEVNLKHGLVILANHLEHDVLDVEVGISVCDITPFPLPSEEINTWSNTITVFLW